MECQLLLLTTKRIVPLEVRRILNYAAIRLTLSRTLVCKYNMPRKNSPARQAHGQYLRNLNSKEQGYVLAFLWRLSYWMYLPQSIASQFGGNTFRISHTVRHSTAVISGSVSMSLLTWEGMANWTLKKVKELERTSSIFRWSIEK